MQRFVYLLAYPFLWAISRLPFPLLYLLSDGLFILLYRLVRYRRKVVRENLALAFPEKTDAERRVIEKDFYNHLCDVFMEMVKTMGISKKELLKRYTFTNLDVIHRLEAKGKSIMLLAPHYASWEWAFALDPYVKGEAFAVYQPLTNRYFDRWARRTRKRFGTTLITTRETSQLITKNRQEGRLAFYGMLIDHSPMLIKTQHWGPFMGIQVPMHTGAEYLCKKMDLPVIYMKVRKLRRGYYEASFKLLTENPSEIPDFQITDAFFREVEHSIREAPEHYFWTHKRWKHRDKAPGGPHQSGNKTASRPS
jgi:KDO2-lipid IV(A) lauroyltransferase